jgi:hypothetical protein
LDFEDVFDFFLLFTGAERALLNDDLDLLFFLLLTGAERTLLDKDLDFFRIWLDLLFLRGI